MIQRETVRFGLTRPWARSALALGQAEPVTGVVLKDGFNSIEALDRLTLEDDAARLELGVRLSAIVRLEHGGAELAARDQPCEGFTRSFVQRGPAADGHQHDLEIRLALGSHGEPAKGAHGLLGSNLEP